MIITHNQLKDKARELLRKKGFKNSEIKDEYSVKLGNKRFQIVDIVGIKKDKKIAIECGGINKNLDPLRDIFDEVIVLPYVSKSGAEYHCSNCDHQWRSRVETPLQCPKCKRYFEIVPELKRPVREFHDQKE